LKGPHARPARCWVHDGRATFMSAMQET
jgi:hypothetical protein